jgi:DUF177 domain-containing protein
MQIELSSLPGKTGKFAHVYTPGELVLDDERLRLAVPLKVSGKITRNERKVVVEGHLSAVTGVECDRCLKPMELPIDTEFKVEYVTPATYNASDVAELGEDDLALSVFDGELINIDEIVGEQVLLAVPSQAVCNENCRGLCPICGTDLNVESCTCQETEIDPRWQGLKELVNGKW